MREYHLRRREFLSVVCAGAATFCARAQESRPNFVLIMADDLGYSDLGCYGSEAIRTPHLDALAKGGVRFTDFHSNGAVCSPTRTALLTGHYQQRHGIDGVVTAKNHRDTGLPLESVTFAEMLKQAGYATALFGKWHVGYQPSLNPVRQGFDAFEGYVSGNVDYHSHIDQAGYEDWWHGDALQDDEGYVTDLITDRAVRFIEQHKREPFCLYLPHEAPHYPLQGRTTPAFRKNGVPQVRTKTENPEAIYKEMVEVMDEGVGRVMAALREHGLERNTLVFFCSDNGPTKLGSCAPLRGNKGAVWEGGHRVPAIAYWPGRITPGESDATLMTMDLFPTLAALAGVKIREVDGVDLAPILFHGEQPPQRTLFWRFGVKAAVRKGPWKVVAQKTNRDAQAFKSAQLFNLDNDIAEEHDLAESEPEKLVELVSAYWAWERDVTQGVTMRT